MAVCVYGMYESSQAVRWSISTRQELSSTWATWATTAAHVISSPIPDPNYRGLNGTDWQRVIPLLGHTAQYLMQHYAEQPKHTRRTTNAWYGNTTMTPDDDGDDGVGVASVVHRIEGVSTISPRRTVSQ